MASNTFLTAEWRKLAIANYAIDKSILTKYLPGRTELDLWNNKCYVSLVGFRFINTKLKGLKIPFHSDFEEVNLRFYVKYKDGGQWKRGVTFIKEFVPKPAITLVANTIYKEKYGTVPMSHFHLKDEHNLAIEYKWKKKDWHHFKINAHPFTSELKIGSEEEFITEHYWGYTKLDNYKTSEYGVEHPRWEMYKVKDHTINVDFGTLYGKEFSFLNNEKPLSVMLAEGSEIQVKSGRRV